MSEIERPLEGDFLCWVVIVAALAVFIGIVIWAVKNCKENQRLGRRSRKKRKSRS